MRLNGHEIEWLLDFKEKEVYYCINCKSQYVTDLESISLFDLIDIDDWCTINVSRGKSHKTNKR